MKYSSQDIKDILYNGVTSSANQRRIISGMCRNGYCNSGYIISGMYNHGMTCPGASSFRDCTNCPACIPLQERINYVVDKSFLLKDYSDLINIITNTSCQTSDCQKCKFFDSKHSGERCIVSRMYQELVSEANGDRILNQEKFIASMVELLSAKS